MRTCMSYTVSVWTRGPPLSPPGPAPHRPLHRPPSSGSSRVSRRQAPRAREAEEKHRSRDKLAIDCAAKARSPCKHREFTNLPVSHISTFSQEKFSFRHPRTPCPVCVPAPPGVFLPVHTQQIISMKFTPVFFCDASLALLTRGPRRRRLDGDRLSIPQPGGRH